jgi:diguanylate cyclase (GGDEF)-like protein
VREDPRGGVGGWSVGDSRYTATLEALLAASYRLSDTVSTGQAADVLAETACALMGADGAHVHLPEELGGSVWSNANALRTPEARGTVSFDVAREGPDLLHCIATGEALFVADALAVDVLRRPLRLRLGMASLWFIPLLDVGVLVLGWTERRAAPPAFVGDWAGFVTNCAQALRRRIVTTSLQDLSRTDPLTGLDNRRVLMEVLSSLPAGGGLLLIDLDHFKQVNDTLGHRHGDQVLQSFARLLQDLTPQAVSVARYGGEEFAVVFETHGRNAGEQVFTELQRSWRVLGMAFSAGLAEHRHGGSGEETLEAADRALYRAKQAGRDRLAHAPDVAWAENPSVTGPLIVSPRSAPEGPALGPRPRPGSTGGDGARSSVGDVTLSLDELDAALRGGFVTPYYQPVVDTRTGRVGAVEALARITHPITGALVMPAQFLPLAERTGRVRTLDRQVAAAAITQLAGWREDPQMTDLRVAVNVSVDHLGDQDLPTFLSDQCRTAGVPADAVVVEITETLQSVTGRHHEGVVEQLREAGLQVALDDFGTGFSSLSYLLRFPVTAIKVDLTFTAALADERGQHLVQGILSTALRMGLSVVAEGVETAAQRDWLTEHGCPFLQGYLLSPPLPAAYLPAAVGQLDPRTPTAASSPGRRG